MNMLELPGVQMMLGNLIKAAAPELTEKVAEISKVVLAFKAQSDRIEASQAEILKRLEQLGELQNGYRTGNSQFAGAECGTGEANGSIREKSASDESGPERIIGGA
jgi:hypothetical protein